MFAFFIRALPKNKNGKGHAGKKGGTS